jgi:thiamine-phosphate pyrophosphorylase
VSGATRLDPRTLRLVAIADSLREDGVDGLVSHAASAVHGGATMLQLRLKDESARTLVEVARRLRAAAPGTPLLVNGRADVALAAGAAGVHLDVGELAPAVLRRIVPAGFLLGLSVAGPADANDCREADYVAVGPVFGPAGVSHSTTGIGLEGLTALVRCYPVPVLALGGITPDTVAAVMATGAAGVGVISGIRGASDLTARVRALRDVLDASER